MAQVRLVTSLHSLALRPVPTHSSLVFTAYISITQSPTVSCVLHLSLSLLPFSYTFPFLPSSPSPLPPVAASSGLDGYIKLWSLTSGEQLRSIDGGPVDVWTLAFSPDSKSLASGSHNGKINLFSVEDGKKESSLDTRGKFIMSIAYVSHVTVMW